MLIEALGEIDKTVIEQFKQRWKIEELYLFGSSLREDFSPNSDVDFLVTFNPDAHWTLLDWVQMENELAEIVGCPVDLVSKSAIEESPNGRRRDRILSSTQPLVLADE